MSEDDDSLLSSIIPQVVQDMSTGECTAQHGWDHIRASEGPLPELRRGIANDRAQFSSCLAELADVEQRLAAVDARARERHVTDEIVSLLQDLSQSIETAKTAINREQAREDAQERREGRDLASALAGVAQYWSEQ